MLGGGGIKAFKNFLDISSILIVIGGNNSDNCCGISIWRNKKNIRKVFSLFYIEEKKI